MKFIAFLHLSSCQPLIGVYIDKLILWILFLIILIVANLCGEGVKLIF